MQSSLQQLLSLKRVVQRPLTIWYLRLEPRLGDHDRPSQGGVLGEGCGWASLGKTQIGWNMGNVEPCVEYNRGGLLSDVNLVG